MYILFNYKLTKDSNQILKSFNSDVFKSIDFSSKINFNEDGNNYYIHADLSGMNKDQTKMEFSDGDRILTISVERETTIDDFNMDSN
ncbi:hypothetical protein H8356DRAFT_1354943 [Neocallimastix lanati (nom. inval.)]|nr:hypothetical protein H8356DRAFT_1354943 [Neocallimastix sp. JGI-2020a]